MLVSALKFRFNHCENKGFEFKRLAQPSKNKRPHKAIPEPDLREIF
jgi:hypothetical protein